ncbi:MAG: O-antigen ligase family protein [Synergistaceae bacterium]|nr:O-antigen ligase family protein [Synergistaceae bacterium]
MKKKNLLEKKNLPVKDLTLPLVPAGLLLPLWFISLALPNLVYSGIRFADTLHILKWAVTGVPVAIAVFVAGLRLFYYGRERIKFKIDLFGAIWALILTYCVLQPFWVDLFSPTAFALEMVCFVTMWAFYVISVASFPDWGLRPVLILASLNAALNVLFAELQIRDMNNLNFLQGTILEWMIKYSTIILPTPGNYIGNTAQQNMFGLWEAVACLGVVYLFAFDVWKDDEQGRSKKIWLPALSISFAVICVRFAITQSSVIFAVLGGLLIIWSFILAWKLGNDKRTYFSVVLLILAAINFWGLLNSTSRSGILALFGGLILFFIFAAWKFDRNYVLRFLAVMLVLATVFTISMDSRAGDFVNKTADIIQHAENIGNRRGIWTTSFAMFREHPEGVGIGQYKWHYLEAQRYGFQTINEDWYTWQYTHWAHNEFLQFFCEGGYIGGTLFILMWLSWLIPALYGLFKKKRGTVNINAVWGFALVSLITFAGIFTRPFHRIENIVWITLAFAMCNRELFPVFRFNLSYEIFKSKFLRKLVGFSFAAASIAGCIYIGSGIYGNYILREALSTQDARLQLYYLEEANKHPIVREETQRNLGYHYLQVGEQLDDMEATARGLNILWQHFNREPHSEDISKLLNVAQRYQVEEVLREIKSYFKPGMYHLVRRPQRNEDGSIINALLLVNGPGSDDK